MQLVRRQRLPLHTTGCVHANLSVFLPIPTAATAALTHRRRYLVFEFGSWAIALGGPPHPIAFNFGVGALQPLFYMQIHDKSKPLF